MLSDSNCLNFYGKHIVCCIGSLAYSHWPKHQFNNIVRIIKAKCYMNTTTSVSHGQSLKIVLDTTTNAVIISYHVQNVLEL